MHVWWIAISTGVVLDDECLDTLTTLRRNGACGRLIGEAVRLNRNPPTLSSILPPVQAKVAAALCVFAIHAIWLCLRYGRADEQTVRP